MILKFKDKHDIIMLSTKHDSGLNQSSKSFVIEDYNKGKIFVDVSDKMCSYSPFIPKTTKRYIRLLFHITTQTMIVDSCVLYRNIFGNIKLNMFKRQVFVNILNPIRPSTPTKDISLKKVESYCESRKCFLSSYQAPTTDEDSRRDGKKPSRCLQDVANILKTSS